ncbi:hypothetical protein [Lederbergia lenta]|uniref:Uncharacterized protein n=1 Tax=Lederbergia lenta TaxID=1467 RepID=A0A2X4W4N3_LEDLE|nr:hypothetical protein [Lederbergia lenta]MCM3109719.1 hypothetical protein [Lederbergia lenta]MEC2324530.1 hypothetical protein [Lederbergia lenta]SQI59577.1 Uncharacterised protein [Lederbergia lenta]
MSKDVVLYLASILSAYAILGLIVYVPGLITAASPLLLTGIVIVVIVVLLFAAAIILKALSQLLGSFRP